MNTHRDADLVRMTPGVAGGVLWVAGVAALALERAGHCAAAERTRDLQDAVDDQLSAAPFSDVLVPRELVGAAADLWELGAEALEASAVNPDLSAGSQAGAAASRHHGADRLRRDGTCQGG